MQDTQKTILGIIGKPLAGKSTVCEYLLDKRKGKRILISESLKKILEILDLPSGRDTMSSLSFALRQAFGESILMKPVVNEINKHSGFILIDGIRKRSEVEILKSLNGKLMYVQADDDARFQRYKKRLEKSDDGVGNMANFLSHQNFDSEKSVEELKEFADFRVDNSKSLQELVKQLDEVLAKL